MMCNRNVFFDNLSIKTKIREFMFINACLVHLAGLL
jgi:hypothetical protein